MINKVFPILSWLSDYNKDFFKKDLFAGLTVGVMLIPQGMAYALIAGLPPVYGLYAAFIPLIVYSLFGTSRQLSVGPVAMDSLLVAAGLSAVSFIGEENYVAMAIVMAFLIGLIQLSMGVLRLGFLVNFLSKPVINGFTSAAAIIIGINQIKYLLGFEISRSNHVQEVMIQVFQQLKNIHPATALVGAAGVILLLLMKKYFSKLPSSLIVVVIGIIASAILGLENQGVNVVGEIPSGLPGFSIPDFSLEAFGEMWAVALTLSLIGFTEAISISKALEEKNGVNTVRPNQELIALGFANTIGSFFQSYVVSGGFSRSAVNNDSGAKTGMASIISAAVIGLTLLFLTPLFYYLPQTILAAVIIVAVFGLVDYKFPLQLWNYKRDDLAMLLVTFVVTLTVGIKEGVIVGVLLSLGFLIYRSAKPHIAELGEIKGTRYFRNVNRFKEVEQRNDVLIFRFDGQLYFANCNYFRTNLFKMADKKGEALKLIVLDAEAINHIDSSAVNMLEGVIEELSSRGVKFYMSDVIGPVRDVITKSGLIDILGVSCLFMRTADALDFYDGCGDCDENEQYKFKNIASQADC